MPDTLSAFHMLRGYLGGPGASDLAAVEFFRHDVHVHIYPASFCQSTSSPLIFTAQACCSVGEHFLAVCLLSLPLCVTDHLLVTTILTD